MQIVIVTNNSTNVKPLLAARQKRDDGLTFIPSLGLEGRASNHFRLSSTKIDFVITDHNQTRYTTRNRRFNLLLIATEQGTSSNTDANSKYPSLIQAKTYRKNDGSSGNLVAKGF
jgi:hypothetical protein